VLIHLPEMLLAAGAMLGAAVVLDLLRPLLIREEGEQNLRSSDRLLINVLFFSLTPGMLYAWFYPLVPFSGFRAGLFLAVILFLLGIAPTFAVYRLAIEERTTATLGHLVWLLLKYLVVYGLLAAIYQP
jgi:hypothetical protein